MSSSENRGAAFGAIFWILILLLEVLGLIHSARKHSDDGWLAWWLPPFAVYRGAEMFWHRDRPELGDWDTQVNSDISIACKLMNLSNDKDEVDKINTQMIRYQKKVSNYPSEMQQRIQNGVKTYIRFGQYCMNDLNNYLTDTSVSKPDTISFSKETSVYFDSLYNYYQLADVEAVKQLYDSLPIKMNLINWSKEQVNDYKAKISDIKSATEETTKQAFFKLFKVTLNL